MEKGSAGQTLKQLINKQATGISGLDEVLQGGLPKERVTVIRGGHGTGKTVFALEFLWRLAHSGTPGLFITFEEEADSVRANALAMGWNLQQLEDEKKLSIVSVHIPPDMVLGGEFNIDGAIAIIRQQAKLLDAGAFALDAADGLLNLFPDHAKRNQYLQTLHTALRDLRLTGIITAKKNDVAEDSLAYIADCVLQLDQRVAEQISTRRLRVTKYRGSGFLSNEHPFLITTNGIKLVPISGMTLTHCPPTARVSSGNTQLDTIAGGGYFRGACAVVAGASGTGKTTLACTFAEVACAAGDRVLYVSYEESEASLVYAMRSPGLNLRTYLDSGNLHVLASLPEAVGPDQHLLNIVEAIAEFSPNHLIVDAVSATERMGTASAAFDFQVRLIYLCKDRGITCIFVTQSREWAVTHEMGKLDMASMAETVVALQQEWSDHGFERRISVVKSRGTEHSSGVFPFDITSHGLDIAKQPCSGKDVRSSQKKGSTDE